MALNQLTEKQVATATKAVGDGHGLWLLIRKNSTGLGRYWAYRYSWDGEATAMNLGAYPAVSLGTARELRNAAADLRARGIDPKAHAAEQATKRLADQASVARRKTFDEAAAELIANRAPEWRSLKHGDQWRNTIAQYVSPVIGSKNVADVTQDDVLGIVKPVWYSKTETARRVLNRISLVLTYAKAKKYREGDNPADWETLRHILPSAQKLIKKKLKPHAALDYHALPAFLQSRMVSKATGVKALCFAILTASRSGEVRGARWSEFTLDEARWDVPGSRIKNGKDHRRALSQAAVDLLRSLPQGEPGDLVFPSPYKPDTPLSDATLNADFKRAGIKATAHGTARASFRTWSAEQTHFPHEVLEMALAHDVSTEVERAYRRTDLYAKRVEVAEAWSNWLLSKPAANVVKLPRAQAAALKPELLAALLADKATQAAKDRFVLCRERQRELEARRQPGVPDPGALAVTLLDLVDQLQGWNQHELVTLADTWLEGDTITSIVMAETLTKVRAVVAADQINLAEAARRTRTRRRRQRSGPKPDRLLALLVMDLAGVLQSHASDLKALTAFTLAVNETLPKRWRVKAATLTHVVKTMRTRRG